MKPPCKKCNNEDCREWVKNRPKSVQKMIAKRPACKAYIDTFSGDVGYISSYEKDGNLCMIFSARDNPELLQKAPGGYRVSDITPDWLMEV